MNVRNLTFLLACVLAPTVLAAQAPQVLGNINGYAKDADDAAIPGAQIVISGTDPADPRPDLRSVKADPSGYFLIQNVRPSVIYHLTANAPGFNQYNSPDITIAPGQTLTLDDVKLSIGSVGTSITVVPDDILAVEQVQAEESQRVLGIIPNFYVVYDSHVAPLSAKLKFKLAYKATTDPVNLFASAFLAGIYQAADTPDYVQGAKGYGQRMGAIYANGVTDILVGGAILPALLHQDPRYYYQGTGTKKSRAFHAIASPFICKGDNGKPEFNFSSVGGDLVTGAVSNLYYPQSNRGPGLVFDTAAITTAGRMLNALAQEFLLSKLTTKHPKN